MMRPVILAVGVLWTVPFSSVYGQVQKVWTGFRYTEGPVADRDGNLYFTDYKDGPGKIYRLDPKNRLSVLVSDSNRANGLAINGRGEIVACQANGQVVAYSPDGSTFRVLTSSFAGRRYNAPNNSATDANDGVYFTDPYFESPRPFRPQPVSGVYYISPTGEVTRVIEDRWNPNGILLSPDEKTLYVVPSMERHVWAYPVLSPGKLGCGRKFCRLAPSHIPLFPGGDGATLDAEGNLYVATFAGVQVFDPAGKLRGILSIPERPSNVGFGADKQKLYITAGRSLYAVKLTTSPNWPSATDIPPLERICENHK